MVKQQIYLTRTSTNNNLPLLAQECEAITHLNEQIRDIFCKSSL